MVVDVGGDHELVGRRAFGELLEACSHTPRISDDLHRAIGIGQAAFGGTVRVGQRLPGARQRSWVSATHANPGQLHGGGELLRMLVGLGTDDRYGEDGRGTLEVLRWLEALVVGAHGRGRVRRAEMRGEGVAEAHLPGRSRRVAAGAQKPDRRQPDVARHSDHRPQRVAFGESVARERQELAKLLREEISWEVEGVPAGTYVRQDERRSGARRATVIGQRKYDEELEAEEWLVFERPAVVPGGPAAAKVEAAFRLDKDDGSGKEAIVRAASSDLVAFFPTEKETHLGFLLQGPYKTTPARDNITYPDALNEALVEETADLVVEALHKIRDLGLLTAGFLQVLPLDTTYFAPGSPFRPVFERVRKALTEQPLLPTQSGHFVRADSAKLADSGGLRELVSDDQLEPLLASPRALRWLPGEITRDRTPQLREYLRETLQIEEITPDSFARRLGATFMKRQTHEWIIRLYSFLDEQKALWRPRTRPGQEPGPLRNRPFVRLQDSSHVVPFGADGKTPKVFLPIEGETDLPTVKREVAADERARQFLVNLGLTEPDIVDEVITKILPKYPRNGESDVSDAGHERDMRKIVQALETDSASKGQRLIEQLLVTPFLRAHNAGTGRAAFRRPGSIYLRSLELELYFRKNPSTWFLDERYAGYERELTSLDVSGRVRVTRRQPRSYGVSAGHVVISEVVSNHARGLDGFDPSCQIDGLENP